MSEQFDIESIPPVIDFDELITDERREFLKALRDRMKRQRSGLSRFKSAGLDIDEMDKELREGILSIDKILDA